MSQTADAAALADVVAALAKRRVLVVGDLVLDEYLTGRPSRISREAPVLILTESERETRAGSAGSPAANVVSLGSWATIVGVVGDDVGGAHLAENLHALGVDCTGLLVQAGSLTATKTRILAEGFTGGLHGRQQVLRIDREMPLTPASRSACVQAVRSLAPAHEAILLSDYRAGVVDDGVIHAARSSGRPVLVDSQGSLDRFHDVDLIKVNQAEAQSALGSEDVLGQGDNLRRSLRIRHLIVTLGPHGIAVFSDEEVSLLPVARETEVFDVTGAGDTVAAVLTLALIAGIAVGQAAYLANAAAGLVVRRLGVATVSPAELTAALLDQPLSSGR